MPDIFVGNTLKNDNPKSEEITESKAEEKRKNKELKSIDLRKQIIEFEGNEGHSHNHLTTAYCERPLGVTFADRLENEELLLFLRKHFITNVPWIVSALALVISPFIFIAITQFGGLPINFLPPIYIFMILLLYYFFVVGFIFVNYLTWFYNIGLVTDKRIIDIDFSSLVFENVDATKLSQVEDVGYKQVGIIRSIFDYGDVHIHTAGPAANFEFLAVPHPERIINIINDLIGKVQHIHV
ncbi:MAG: PH domain-containing protein [Candidatus Levybacteria bacterium]|nr:PH domain-containing protein [Candidatus Levybacteria bacterium]